MPLSRRTTIAFREHLVGWTLRRIGDEFDAAKIQANKDHQPDNMSGERRIYVEQHYSTLSLRNPSDEARLLDFFEGVLLNTPEEERDDLIAHLERDGYLYEGHQLRSKEGALGIRELERATEKLDAGHLREHIRRMSAFVNTDPALAIGAAKELVEGCCKTILHAREKPVDDKPDLPKLMRRVADELGVLPEEVPEQAKGRDAILRTLGSLANIVQGLAELRNLYGTGHGKDGRWIGVHPRHARLALGSASTLTTFLMETHLQRGGWADPTKIDGRYTTQGFDDRRSGAEINLVELEGGDIEVQGFSLWINPIHPPEEQAPHTGMVYGVARLEGNKFTVREEECELVITRSGEKLVVKDNSQCGGMNVSFTGEYERVGPPQMVNL